MGGKNHGGRAIAALHAMGFAERVLQGRQLTRPGRQALDGGDGVAVGLHREHQARAHGCAVDQNRAGATAAMFASGVGAGEQQLIAQAIEQRHARFDLDCALLVVDVEFNLHARHAAEPKASVRARIASVTATRRR